MVGQDAQGNEPSNHIPYLYSFAGAPWKTQERVRQVARLYNNTPAGVPGNDDCGQISTWFNFAALGFYPVNAVTGVYVLGSPLVNHATLRVPGAGKTFTIVAENNSDRNIYVQSVDPERQAADALVDQARGDRGWRGTALPHGQRAEQEVGFRARRPPALRADRELEITSGESC